MVRAAGKKSAPEAEPIDARDSVDYISLGWARQENGGLLLVVPEDLRGDPHTIFMLEMEGENRVRVH